MVRFLILVVSLFALNLHAQVQYEHHSGELPIESFWSGGPPQNFDKALVLNGIGLDFGVHMGMIDASIDFDQKPDVIIGTCGGAVSAGIHQAFPQRRDRIQFLTSEELHQFVLSPYANAEKPSKLTAFKIFAGAFMRKIKLTNRVQNYFPYSMAHLPQDAIPPHLGTKMTGADGIKYITLAAKTELTPENIKKAKIRGQKHYTEVLMTDSETAPFLKGYQSPIGIYYDKSLVQTETEVLVDQPFSIAIRAGISDPYVFEPGFFHENYFLTGGINLNPIELARGVAKEVTFAFRNGFAMGFNLMTDEGAFHYDTRKRQRLVTSNDATHWVDLTDRPSWGEKKIGFSVTKGLTQDYKVFKENMLKQYVLGYVRAAESFCYPNNYKGHIRNISKKEMQSQVKKSVEASEKLQQCHYIEQLETELEQHFGVEI